MNLLSEREREVKIKWSRSATSRLVGQKGKVRVREAGYLHTSRVLTIHSGRHSGDTYMSITHTFTPSYIWDCKCMPSPLLPLALPFPCPAWYRLGRLRLENNNYKSLSFWTISPRWGNPSPVHSHFPFITLNLSSRTLSVIAQCFALILFFTLFSLSHSFY